MTSIEVVCFANVCRSPVAAAILWTGCPHLTVSSSGVLALPGSAIDSRMAERMQNDFPELSSHRAQRCDYGRMQSKDLILVMERTQREHISRNAPPLRGRVMLLGHWLDGSPEIGDPYGLTDADYDVAITKIRAACAQWIEKLQGTKI